MTNILLLLICLGAGAALRCSGRLPEGAQVSLNAVVVNLGLPALTLVQLDGVQIRPDLMLPVALPWLMFGMSFVMVRIAGRWLRFPRETTGALILCAGLANTSFLGLPMIVAFYGPQHVPTGVLVDQLGTFLVLNSLGLVVATAYMPLASSTCSYGSAFRSRVRSLLTYPPFLALLTALALLPVGLPLVVADLLRPLSSIVIPLALTSIGFQLRFNAMQGLLRPLAVGLGFKLVVAPLALLCLSLALQQRGSSVEISLFDTALGPQIGAGLLAMQHGLDQRVVAAMVGLGLLLSLLTAPLWSLLIRWSMI